MCIIAFKPAGKKLTKECLLECYSNNRDGAGFAYFDPEVEEVAIVKGFFNFDKFWEYYQPYQDLACIIHFRVATHKAVNGKNCHPWRVLNKSDKSNDLVFAHNGSITEMSENLDLSDTGNFAAMLTKMMENTPDFYEIPQFKWLVSNAVGHWNKLVFMDSKGKVFIINEKEGTWHKQNGENVVWFSNQTYKSSRKGFKVLEDDPDEPAYTPPPVKQENFYTPSNNNLHQDINSDELGISDEEYKRILDEVRSNGCSEITCELSVLDNILNKINKEILVSV